MKKATILHLRFPFSFFLMPVYLFALAVNRGPIGYEAIAVWVILHLLVYPASNGYNSYFDKDEQSIGGLKHPPKVSKELYRVSLILDLVALVWAILVNVWFGVMVLVYGLVSKAYSHPLIRLKSYPILGWLTIGFFQGYFTFLMCIVAFADADWSIILSEKYQYAAILSSILLLGSYPMTQVYQHEEDSKRGDRTMSLMLGVVGTFHFTAIIFSISTVAYLLYFDVFFSRQDAIIFLISLAPVLLFFGSWYLNIRKVQSAATFDQTMRLNWISAMMLNGFFSYLIF